MGIEWKEEYSVNVKEIDKQHKQLIKIINDLLDVIDGNKMEQELNGILEQLQNYAVYHFSTEEKYFRMFDYEGTDEHVRAHNSFKEKIQSLIKDYKDKEIELSFDLIDFLEDWLIEHLWNMDKKYVKCFNEHGLS